MLSGMGVTAWEGLPGQLGRARQGKLDRSADRIPDFVRTGVVGGVAVYAANMLLELLHPNEAVFFGFVLGLPVLVGITTGAREWRPAAAAAPFVVAYLIDLVHNWIATGGDRLFHLALALITGSLAAGAATAARAITRRNHRP